MPSASVSIEREAPDDELQAVEDACRAAGITGTFEADLERKSLDIPHWVMYVIVAYPIAAFFRGFFEEAGAEGWHVFERWVSDVRKARHGRDGSTVIRDDAGTHVVLPVDIPDDALEQLREMDWDSDLPGGYWVWDGSAREWRKPLDR